MLCVSIYISLIKCGSVSINGIKKRERERTGLPITTHHVVGENNRETDEKESWQKKKLLSTLS